MDNHVEFTPYISGWPESNNLSNLPGIRVHHKICPKSRQQVTHFYTGDLSNGPMNIKHLLIAFVQLISMLWGFTHINITWWNGIYENTNRIVALQMIWCIKSIHHCYWPWLNGKWLSYANSIQTWSITE